MRVLVTGGAGFIGANTVDRLLNDGHEVAVIDDLSRRGSERNLDWLRQRHGPIPFYRLDVRDYGRVLDTMGEYREVDLILHFAAQVAVTTSVDEPRRDFEINALGAFNVLEAVRELGLDPVLMYSSTNKVYGALSQMRIIEEETRRRSVRANTHGFLLSVWLFQRDRRPVLPGLSSNLWTAHDRLSKLMHLWAAPVWSGGSGLGGVVCDCGRARTPDHDLR
jgi:nucleoside-diphosphate-sugar epimerase